LYTQVSALIPNPEIASLGKIDGQASDLLPIQSLTVPFFFNSIYIHRDPLESHTKYRATMQPLHEGMSRKLWSTWGTSFARTEYDALILVDALYPATWSYVRIVWTKQSSTSKADPR